MKDFYPICLKTEVITLHFFKMFEFCGLMATSHLQLDNL